MSAAAHPRITIESDKRAGKACIRGHRITVEEILRWLASGASEEEILRDYPQLQEEDFQAIYAYAADQLMTGVERLLIDEASAVSARNAKSP